MAVTKLRANTTYRALFYIVEDDERGRETGEGDGRRRGKEMEKREEEAREGDREDL